VEALREFQRGGEPCRACTDDAHVALGLRAEPTRRQDHQWSIARRTQPLRTQQSSPDRPAVGASGGSTRAPEGGAGTVAIAATTSR
jgi:hypothetical protein